MADIETTRGDSRKVIMPFFDADLDEYRLVDNDQTQNPTVNDIDEIQYQVSDSPEDETTHITKDTNQVDIIPADEVQLVSIQDAVSEGSIPADAAVFTVRLTESDTQPLPTGALWHELQIKDINNNVSTIMRGDFEVIESATNPN